MKGKDLFLLAGGALLVYMLIPKRLAEAAAPGVSVIEKVIPGPTQFIPQLIPQFIPTQGEQGPSEWDIFQMFQSWTEQIAPGLTDLDVEKAVQDALNKFLPTEEQQPAPGGAPSITPEIPEWLKNLLPGGNGAGAAGRSWIEKLLGGESLYPTGITKSIGETITDVIEAPFRVGQEVFDEQGLFSADWWTSMMPEWALTERGKALREYGAESEAVFAKAGVKYITPEWLYARRAAASGLLPEQLLAIREAGSGVSSESYTVDEKEYWKLQEVPGR